MQAQGSATAVLSTDYYPPELRRLCLTALTVLQTHSELDGLCAICKAAWPCDLARLAEHNLALL
jgi:hypothetical protein